jgi:outer membrane protein
LTRVDSETVERRIREKKVTSVSKAILGAAVAAAMTVGAPAAQAFDVSKLTARVGAIWINPADKSDAITGLVGKNDIDVSNELAPDIDFEYGFTPHFGVELLLTIPTKHQVDATLVGGSEVRLGSVTHLPPTVTGKYYFLTDRIRPYVGAGVNVTWFTKDKLTVPTKLDVDDWSIGPALQAGVDISINDQWSVSLDAKKIWIRTDVSIAGGAKLTTVKVDPWVLGVRFGYRFGGAK